LHKPSFSHCFLPATIDLVARVAEEEEYV